MLNNGTTPPPSSNRTCGFPASGSRVNFHRAVTCQALSQLHQPKALEVRMEALPAPRTIRTLRAASQVLREARANIRIERAKGRPRITLSKVVAPAVKVAIERVEQLRQRHMALTMIREFMHSRARAFQRFLRYRQVQIPLPPSQQVAIVSERVAQEVQTLSRLVEA